MKPAMETSKKKPYSTPELVVYGNLQQITNAVGNMGAKDGGFGKISRTQSFRV
jgi:hypothetical protein